MPHPIKITNIYWHPLSFYSGYLFLFGIFLGQYAN